MSEEELISLLKDYDISIENNDIQDILNILDEAY
tara:strand:- start:6474 stop:6575 length:102 start_codon:yes stop_codon:yes gene_type:complete